MDGVSSLTVVGLVVSAIVVSLLSLFLWAYNEVVLKPKRILAFLQAQGIRGPPFRPLVGNTPDIRKILRQRDSDPAFAASTTATPYADYLIEQYGTLTYACLGPFARVMLMDPSLVRAVYIAHNGAFHKPLYLRRLLPLFGNGLVTANGDDWAKQRRLLTPAFRHAELKRMHVTMLDCTCEAIAALREGTATMPSDSLNSVPTTDASVRSPAAIHADMDKVLANLTLEIICRCAFGSRIGEQGDMASELLGYMKTFYVSLLDGFSLTSILPVLRDLPFPANLSLWRSRDGIQRIGLRLVAERKRQRADRLAAALEREGKEGEGEQEGREGEDVSPREGSDPVDLLELMLAATDNEEREARGGGGEVKAVGLSNQDLLDEISTFLLAGHETTANTVGWAMMLLAQHPDWQDRAREEVSRVVEQRGTAGGGQDGKVRLAFEHMGDLKVLGAIINETLRLYPAAGSVVRHAVKTVKLSDKLTIPAGCDVNLSIMSIHRLKEYWGEDADEFKPERFMGAGTPGRGAFMPFTIGPRTCIGQNFAVIEAKSILTMLLQHFRWELSPEFRLHPEMLLTVKNKHGIPMLLHPI